jgi:hypothetical protein
MSLKKHLPKTAIITKQEYNMVAYHKPSSKESVFPEMYLYFDVVVGLAWLDHPENNVGGSVATGRTSHGGQVVSCTVPVGNVSWMLFQEGRSSKLRL